MRKRFFSLIELVVVIVLLAVVAVVLLSIVISADNRNRKLQMNCMFGNMKEIAMALSLYGDDNRSYLPDGNNAAGLSSLLRFKYLDDSKLFVCPATLNTPAGSWQELSKETISGNGKKDATLHCSYLYKGGLYMNDLTPDTIVLKDKPENHKKTVQFINGSFAVQSIQVSKR